MASRAYSPVAAVLLGGLLIALAFDDGGYFASAIETAGTIACAGLLALLALPATRRRLPPAAPAPVLALAALAAWTGLSGRWSPAPETALLDVRRDLLYVGLFGLALVAADGRRAARRTARLVLGVIVVVATAGVLSRLAPDLLGHRRGASVVFDERLSYPLGYWNAFGALAAMGLVLALGMAGDLRARAYVRALCAAAGPLLVVAVVLSLSRGAWLAFVAGSAVLLLLAPQRVSVALSALVVAAAAALAVVRLGAHPQVFDGTRAPGPGAPRLAVEIALLCALAGAAQGLLAVAGWRPHVSRRVAVVAAGVALAGSGAVLVQGGASWMVRQVDAFRAPTSLRAEHGPARLLSAGGLRNEAYGAALAGFRAQPLRGEGAGSFPWRWARSRTTDLPLRDAHSLVLGTMTELGVVGLALLLAFLVAVGRAALRCRRGAAMTAAVATWLVHACVDWDWEMPALTGCALVLCATLFARPADPLQKRHARVARAVDA